MTTTEEQEIECMFCRKPFLSRYFHTHLEMCSQHSHIWDNNAKQHKSEGLIDVTIEAINGKTYNISGLNLNDQISKIKTTIDNEYNINIMNEILTHNNQQLDDNKTLKDYNINQNALVCIHSIENNTSNEDSKQLQTEDMLNMSHMRDETINHEIFLKMLNGKIIALNIELNNKINRIKQLVYKQQGISINKQVLVLCGQ
eukprot:206510_1